LEKRFLAASGIGALHLPEAPAELLSEAVKLGVRVSFSQKYAGHAESYFASALALISEYKNNPKVRIAAALPENASGDDIESFIRFARENDILLTLSGDLHVTDCKTLYTKIPTLDPRFTEPLVVSHRIESLTRETAALRLWEEPFRVTLGGADPFREMRCLALLYKGFNMDSTLFPAEKVFLAAAYNGGEALGFATGELRKGYPADFMVVDFNAPHLQPVYNPVSHLVYAAGLGDVKSLFVAGVKI
jgi:cytosine/adenosine deaminase-related metal-dependent hydrolase